VYKRSGREAVLSPRRVFPVATAMCNPRRHAVCSRFTGSYSMFTRFSVGARSFPIEAELALNSAVFQTFATMMGTQSAPQISMSPRLRAISDCYTVQRQV